MSPSEIAILLGVIGTFDLRVQVDELKVRAWQESLDFDMDLQIAKKAVYQHYANSEVAITVSHINRYWRKQKDYIRQLESQEEFRREIEQKSASKASDEIVNKYLAEIRQTLNRSKDASMESSNGEVASN